MPNEAMFDRVFSVQFPNRVIMIKMGGKIRQRDFKNKIILIIVVKLMIKLLSLLHSSQSIFYGDKKISWLFWEYLKCCKVSITHCVISIQDISWFNLNQISIVAEFYPHWTAGISVRLISNGKFCWTKHMIIRMNTKKMFHYWTFFLAQIQF